MSLNWDATRIENFRENFPIVEHDDGTRSENGMIQVIAFYCMFLEMGEITEKNVREFFIRMRVWDKTFGCVGNVNGEPFSISYKDLRKAIGFCCNVITKTRNQFMTKVKKNLAEDVERESNREIKKFEELKNANPI